MIEPSTGRFGDCFEAASPPPAKLPVQLGRAATGAPVNAAFGRPPRPAERSPRPEALQSLRALPGLLAGSATWPAGGLCPGNHDSAGAHESRKTPKGNRWLRMALIEGAPGRHPHQRQRPGGPVPPGHAPPRPQEGRRRGGACDAPGRLPRPGRGHPCRDPVPDYYDRRHAQPRHPPGSRTAANARATASCASQRREHGPAFIRHFLSSSHHDRRKSWRASRVEGKASSSQGIAPGRTHSTRSFSWQGRRLPPAKRPR